MNRLKLITIIYLLNAICLHQAFANSTNSNAQLALDFLQKEDFGQAETYIQKAISSSSHELKYYWTLFEIYKQQERYKDALVPLGEIQKRSEENNGFLISQIVECQFRAEMYDDVIDTIDYFPRKYELSWNTVSHIAVSYFRIGQYDNAILYFKKLLDGAKTDAYKGKWNLSLGNSYRRIGHRDIAKIYYETTLDYAPSPWAMIWLASYALEDRKKEVAYGYVDQFVATCGVPHLINLIRANQLRDIFFEERFVSNLSTVKDRCLAYFSEYESSKATARQRGSRVKCLTTFCIFHELGVKNDQTKFSARIKTFLVELGYSELDIYLEIARLHMLKGNDQMAEPYVSLALIEHRYPFSNSELLDHCQWLKENPGYQADPRFEFEIELNELVAKLDLVPQ